MTTLADGQMTFFDDLVLALGTLLDPVRQSPAAVYPRNLRLENFNLGLVTDAS